MTDALRCRGCGRRLILPATINRAKARCPKCLTKFDPEPIPPAPREPDAYEVFLSQSLPIPKQEVISLDDAPPNPLPRPRPVPPTPPSQEPEPEPLHFPPPFRVSLEVLTDSHRQFRGTMHGVLTPHGLFLEAEPNRPLMFIPVGARVEARDDELELAVPGRRFEVRFAIAELAADTAAFLAGERPVPLPAEYRPPWWLAGVGAIFALGFASGPILLAAVSERLDLGPGLVLSAAFAIMAGLTNAGIALLTKLPTGAKIGSMAILSAALLGLFLATAMLFLREDEPAPTPPPPPPAAPPVEPPQPPTPPPPPEPPAPVTHYDYILREGVTRFEDGPADVTAIAALPGDNVLVAYADGSTRIWQLDQPTFEPPRLGPRAPSPIRRIAFDPTGKFLLLTCDTGLVFASPNLANRAALVVPGEHGGAFFEPNRDRFAVLRGDRIHVRYLPMDLVKNPQTRAKGPFLNTTPQDETLPLFGVAAGLTPMGGKPTFLAWHPGGRLLAGRTDGTIASLPIGGPTSTQFLSTEHRAAVKSWELSPNGDFAFGDADGFVGYWPNRTTKITKFRTGGVAVRQMSFSFCGGELAVLDDAGWLSFWYPDSGKFLFEMKQKNRISAVAFGPHAEVLLLASGRDAEAWWLPELERQAREKAATR